MELSNIEKLLEKYFEGETTISEEKDLKVYFTGEIVPAHLERYKDLFQYFSNESNITTTSSFVTDSVIEKTSWYKWGGIAASIVLISGMFLTKNFYDNSSVDTYDDPELALQKTKEVLNLVSRYMNEGKQDLVYLNEFENTKRKFIK